MYNNGIDMRVLVNGRPTREYSHKGNSFIEARHGTNYSVKIKNDNGWRVMAVISVDGLDVITGKPAEKSNKGYIVDSYKSIEIKGYRVTDDSSAAFVFTNKDDKRVYVAQQKGDKRNSGVIGVRVFREKEAPIVKVIEKIKEVHHHHDHYIDKPYYPYYPPIRPYNPWTPWWGTTYCHGPVAQSTTFDSNSLDAKCSSLTSGEIMSYTANNSMDDSGGHIGATLSAASVSHGTLRGGRGMSGGTTNCSARVQSPGVSTRVVDESFAASNAFDAPISYDHFDTGTKWGKKLDDKVKRVEFTPGEILTELVVYYSTLEALARMGVDLSDEPQIAEDELPQAFKKTSKYCRPPTGWNG